MPTLTEAQTRRTLIDPALTRAGWDLNDQDQVRFEIPGDDFSPAAWQVLQEQLRRLSEQGVTFDVELPAGISDYALYRENGENLAIVEAKRTSIDPRLAVPQAEFYVTEIEKRQAEHLFQTLLHQAFRGEM